MKPTATAAAALLAALAAAPSPLPATAFTATSLSSTIKPLLNKRLPYYNHGSSQLHSANPNSDNGNEEEEENPYADPQYPELEFINYDDPSYSAFQDDDDLSPSTSSNLLSEEETLEEIENMREERRRRNDEFQFETYHSTVLLNGQSRRIHGEWTVFQTDTFMSDLDTDNDSGRMESRVPRLLKWDKVLKVISGGYKDIVDASTEWRVDGERLVHVDTLATENDFPNKIDSVDDTDNSIQWEEVEVNHVEKKYAPIAMTSLDFRGDAGNMCVGRAYTVCDAVPMESCENTDSDDNRHEGPFREMRTELGVTDGDIRFRVKLDYATLDNDDTEKSDDDTQPPPALHLRTLTVCRETLDGLWPRPIDNGIDLEAELENDGDDTIIPDSTARRKDQDRVDVRLFGPSGAPGGLYDPPPVGSEERAIQNYMLLDLEGGATLLLPHRLDQHCDGEEDDDSSFGWVTSLDWTPGKIRYQVDRKVLGGRKLKGLKTLELSEVRGEDADRWRPKDGGVDMRQ
jgi:hypothetical protein